MVDFSDHTQVKKKCPQKVEVFKNFKKFLYKSEFVQNLPKISVENTICQSLIPISQTYN